MIKMVTGQVVIVPDKPRPPRTTGKPKAKPKPKTGEPNPAMSSSAPVVAPTPAAARAPETAPQATAAPASNDSANPSSFAILPPPVPKSAKALASEQRLPPPTRLFDYVFNVVTTDARGKVTGTRQERARNYVEKLGGETVLEMVEIPGGMFLMGIPSGDIRQITQEHGREVERELKERLQEQLQWETPQHSVRLPGYYLSKYEVTQAQ
jgi:formylglycine-generating enzyme required for sulfatase activity